MSDDETPTPAADGPAAAAPAAAEPTETAATAETPGAVATITEAPVAHAASAVSTAAPVTFRSRFLMPLIVPIAVAATIVFFILNISRVFLAAEGNLAVTYISIITVVILGGGTALAASPRVRSSSITLILGGGLFVLLMGGLISIGAASPNVASGPVQCTPVTSKVAITAGANSALRFTPDNPTAKAGCIQITMTFAGSHTFQFDDPVAANAFPQLTVDLKSWAGTLPPGSYKFHCTIPGHEAAGMVGVLTVTK